MIEHPAFPSRPWEVSEEGLHLDILPQSESIFALGNGHLGMRGNLDEGEPNGIPGTYLNSLYEEVPLPYAESGYGYPVSGQSVVNVTNGKLIRLYVDDEPFDVRYGDLRSHRRVLDMREGILRRRAEWASPAGKGVKISSERVVSLSQRAVAAISYEVEPVDQPARLVLQSELLANESVPVSSEDPRAPRALESPLLSEVDRCDGLAVELVHCTRASSLRLAAAMDHVVEGPAGTDVFSESSPDLGRVTVTAVVHPGEKLRLVKFIAYGWSSERSRQALRDQVFAALVAAKDTTFEGLLGEQAAYLREFWDTADVEVDGDPEVQQAVRFALFHILQAGARAERRAIPAKGLTGPGYDGHTFWDCEAFVLPVLDHIYPQSTSDALRWRQSTLPEARARARQLRLAGAAFPWRTISGHECSGYWPAGTAAFHVGADIAHAAIRHVGVTGDSSFEKDVALELLVETARLWMSLGYHDGGGTFRIDGVTGPDEYSAIADNNVYTNLMARENLQGAADAAERNRREAASLGVSEQDIAAWRSAASAMYIPYDHKLGVHPQAEGFTEHEAWDFESTDPDDYPLMLHFPYFDLYRKQVVKQADLVLAMQMHPDAFSDEEKERNFSYYEALTVRDSSLSAGTQAVLAAEVGYVSLAYDYLAEAALVDLEDLLHNTRDGLHLASLAGTWIALVAGLGGMRIREGRLTFAPRLPVGLTRLSFGILYRGRRIRVEATHDGARYMLVSGDPLEILHHGEPLVMKAGGAVSGAVELPSERERPRQPASREPARRGEPALRGEPARRGEPALRGEPARRVEGE